MHCLLGSLLAVCLPSVASAQGPIAAPIEKGNIRIELAPIASGLTAPHYLTHPNNDAERLFVVDQTGDILLLKNEMLQPTPYFSVPNILSLNPGYDERGLLGLAFHPGFNVTGSPGYGLFYTNTSETASGPADFTFPADPGSSVNHQGVIREWTVDPTLDVITGPIASRELIRVDQPQGNHNGGALNFGPDNHLYIGYGDGGGSNDQGFSGNPEGHGPDGNGQNIETILGSVVRINPLENTSSNGQYGVPADNPYEGAAGLDEIYVSGLRNPFQFGFDVDPATGQVTSTATGRFILPDVGQNNIEEVNIANLGDDLGWRYKEGSFFFEPVGGTVSPTAFPSIVVPSGLVDPVLEYDHDEGNSISGGYIFRGDAIPELDGKYVFGDWGNFAGPSGRLFYGDLDTGEIKEFIIGYDDRSFGFYTKGFGRGIDGELYVIAGSSLGPAGTGSSIFKITSVPEPSSLAALALLSTAVMLRRRSRS